MDGNGLACEGQLRGGGEEVRDVLLSGVVVGVTMCDMAKNPSFVHRKPVFKFDWIWFSRRMLIQRSVKPEGANELRALVSKIIKGSKSILSGATSVILHMKFVTIEGLVPVDPGFLAVFPRECVRTRQFAAQKECSQDHLNRLQASQASRPSLRTCFFQNK
jgi:hypothetical protein